LEKKHAREEGRKERQEEEKKKKKKKSQEEEKREKATAHFYVLPSCFSFQFPLNVALLFHY
jgi:hypothetical protein